MTFEALPFIHSFIQSVIPFSVNRHAYLAPVCKSGVHKPWKQKKSREPTAEKERYLHTNEIEVFCF